MTPSQPRSQPLRQVDLKQLLEEAKSAARQAGDIIRSYSGEKLEILSKAGGDSEASQVLTEVDMRCESLILSLLGKSVEKYDLAVLSEEQEDDQLRLTKQAFWCVDPLDGTLAFTESRPGYAVSIALVANSGQPLIGVIYDPITNTLYSAIKGLGAYRNEHPWNPLDKVRNHVLTLPCDRSLLKRRDFQNIRRSLESLSLELGLAGLKEQHHAGAVLNAMTALENPPACYFKPPKAQKGGGSLWDFAASACIYTEAGAYVSDFGGEALDLNQANSTFMNERGVIFSTDKDLHRFIQNLTHDIT